MSGPAVLSVKDLAPMLRLEPWTDEAGARILEAQERSRLVHGLRELAWQDLPLDTLRQVVELVRAAKGEG